jgi:thiol-disulfide isomerase/thioredoxin
MKFRSAAAVALTLGLVFAGWQLLSGTSRAGFSFAEARAPQPAPDWKLTDLDGKSLSLSSLKGKVVLLNFWATWCGPCKAEIPDLISLQKKYADQGLVIVGASVDEGGVPEVKAFADKIGINYPVVIATPEMVQSYGNIEAVPTSLVIDRKGQIVNGIQGGTDLKGFEEAVGPALKAGTKL